MEENEQKQSYIQYSPRDLGMWADLTDIRLICLSVKGTLSPAKI